MGLDLFDQASECDFVEVDGVLSPPCEVTGAAIQHDWEVKKGKGQSGATIVFSGTGLTEFTVRVFCERPDHFAQWALFRRDVIARPIDAKNTKAFGVKHPLLAELGVTSAVLKEEGQWLQPQPGQFAKDLKFIQYRAPAPAQGKPAAAKSGGGKFEPAAQDELDATISELKNEMKELAA